MRGACLSKFREPRWPWEGAAAYLFAVPWVLAPLHALAAPFDFDAAPGRLPKNVAPLEYQVSLVPRVDTLSFTGTESIRLQFRESAA